MKTITPDWTKPVIINSPQIGEENQFGSSRKLRFGPLRIAKDGLIANNGTVDAVKVDANGFHGYDSSGTEKIAITPSGAVGYGTDNTSWSFTDAPGGDVKGAMGYNASSTPASFSIIGTDAALMCGTLAGNSAFYTSSGDLFVASNLVSGGGSVYIKGESTDTLVDSGFYIYDFTGGGYVEKTAIVPTSKGFNALYCTESPEVWFMDFARIKRTWKFWKKPEIIADSMFLEVSSPPYIFIPTLDKKIVQIWGKRKGLENKRFEYKSEKEYKANNEFWATPTVKSSPIK